MDNFKKLEFEIDILCEDFSKHLLKELCLNKDVKGYKCADTINISEYNEYFDENLEKAYGNYKIKDILSSSVYYKIDNFLYWFFMLKDYNIKCKQFCSILTNYIKYTDPYFTLIAIDIFYLYRNLTDFRELTKWIDGLMSTEFLNLLIHLNFTNKNFVTNFIIEVFSDIYRLNSTDYEIKKFQYYAYNLFSRLCHHNNKDMNEYRIIFN